MGLLSRNKNIQCRRFIKTKRKRKNRNYLGWEIHKRKTSRICSKTSSKAKRKNYNFEIKMIGNGELLEKTKSQIEKYNLTNQIKLVGAVKSDKVRLYMEKQIYLFAQVTKMKDGE